MVRADSGFGIAVVVVGVFLVGLCWVVFWLGFVGGYLITSFVG